jgi:hypothetical protein
MTTPREQLIEAISEWYFGDWVRSGYSGDEPDVTIEDTIDALSDLGAVVLMPLKVKQIPEGSRVDLSPPIVSLNWPEGAYRPFVNGDSRVYVDALDGRR